MGYLSVCAQKPPNRTKNSKPPPKVPPGAREKSPEGLALKASIRSRKGDHRGSPASHFYSRIVTGWSDRAKEASGRDVILLTGARSDSL
ncbi:MAG: hypothetical protein H6Q30_2755 [Bacteroidetes bacterium]|nr:hypothetical protein [Bacteroidota bacterium]